MGNSLGSKKKNVVVLLCGLDSAGKSTILYKMKKGEDTIPQSSVTDVHIEKVEHTRLSFVVWDISGKDEVRPLWKHYYQNADAVMFVVDSNDRERLGECKQEVQRLFTENTSKNVILLVMANKQDLPNALSAADITDKLGLNEIKEENWYVQATCALSGEGFQEGLDWLQSKLTEKKN